MTGRFDERFLRRFWVKCDRRDDDTDACWIWVGGRDARGYGQIGFCDTVLRAHRVSYEIVNGPIPGGMHVCHSCDNPSCVNPHHLWLGTASDNIRDMVRKGRHLPENKHLISRGPWKPIRPAHKRLTREEVRAIVHAPGPHHRIAARFGISRGHVAKLKNDPSLHPSIARYRRGMAPDVKKGKRT